MQSFACLLASTAVGAQIVGAQMAKEPKYMPFGSTFPMTGSQVAKKSTWGQNVYLGSSMQFNPNAFFGFTNSESVKKYPPPTPAPPSAGSPTANLAPTVSPTAGHHGKVCNIWAKCPEPYYCKTLPGQYSTWQDGTCEYKPNNGNNGNNNGNNGNNNVMINGGTQKKISSPIDANHGGSCAPPSACNYQSMTGDCWCDVACLKQQDCCNDIKAYGCDVGPPLPPLVEEIEDAYIYDNQGDGNQGGWQEAKCVSDVCNKLGYKHSENGKACFCDSVCVKWGDCCHDYHQNCGY